MSNANRYPLGTRHLWEHGQLVTEHTDDRPPTAHYVATEDAEHGHQVTASPRTACGKVVPNSMLTDAVYTDDRCVDCLRVMPDAEPYPAPPVIVDYRCPVCALESGCAEGLIRDADAPELWSCPGCLTRWPDGLAGYGVRVHPDGVDAAGTTFFAPIAFGRDLAPGESAHEVSAYLLTDAMRVRCSHDHPFTWVKVAERRPDDVDAGGAEVVVVRLACGKVATYPRLAGVVQVVVDEPLEHEPAPEYYDDAIDAQ